MSGTPAAPNRRVLIVDDNRAIHEDFAKILRHDRAPDRLAAATADLFGEPEPVSARLSFELDSAFQGAEALAMVQRACAAGRPYAAAFVDVRMPPGWDGIETVERIWREQENLQVILCTAYSDYSWDEMIARLGHSARLVILKKPFDNLEALQLAVALTEKWNLEMQVRRDLEELEATVGRRTDELRKSEERFRLITENAADLIAIVAPSGHLQYHSPSFCVRLGLTDEELRAGIFFDAVHPDDRTRVRAGVADTAAGGATQVVEHRVRHRDGRWLTLETHLAPFRNAGGAVEGVLVAARDISERRMLELMLRQAQKLESIGHLAAGVAHEINTPTQFVGDNARFLQTAFNQLRDVLAVQKRIAAAVTVGGVTPGLLAELQAAVEVADLEFVVTEIPKAIEQSIEGIGRVAEIVRALKAFSHPGGAAKKPVDLRQAIETTLTVCRNEWKHVAEMVTEFDPALPPVPVVPGEFDQVVLNLVINAAHAIADVGGGSDAARGTITIRTRFIDGWAEIGVQDTGSGIPENIRDKIFDPFFTTKPVGKGTGQGLAIARSVVVEKHGGTLTFESETGRGTTFCIRLPVAADPAQVAA